MSLVILRDDDINATTDPARLEAAYAPLLDRGHTLCLSAIPEVALDVRAPDGARERFLDPDWAASDGLARLHEDSPSARWMRKHAGAVAVLQHGHTHARVREGTEFGALTRGEADERIATGRRVLSRALGAEPEGFVAPWDRMSKGALLAATSAYRFVSTSWVERSMLPASRWPAHVRERIARDQVVRHRSGWIVRHPGGWMGPDTDPETVASLVARHAARARVCVVVLHHWMFWEKDEPHPAIRALAKALTGHTVVRPRDADAALAA